MFVCTGFYTYETLINRGSMRPLLRYCYSLAWIWVQCLCLSQLQKTLLHCRYVPRRDHQSNFEYEIKCSTLTDQPICENFLICCFSVKETARFTTCWGTKRNEPHYILTKCKLQMHRTLLKSVQKFCPSLPKIKTNIVLYFNCLKSQTFPIRREVEAVLLSLNYKRT